jgi:hypothetical protein
MDPIYGCHLWTGRLDKDGYPLTGNGRRAHRVAWERAHGPIPPRLELEHGCRRRRCVRPAGEHLKLVTRGTNERLKLWRNRVRQQRCAAGHDLFVHGIRTPEGGRVCRSCAPPGER